jgi:molecular chaperone GrpE
MTEPDTTRREVADDEAQGPVVRDKRRIDPETGLPRFPAGGAAQATTEEQPTVQQPTGTAAEAVDGDTAQLTPDNDLAAERLRDLQRLQAEYVNYRRRVERDRDVARDTAVSGVLEQLLPVLDDVHLARQHGDLEGTPFAAIADKLEAVLGRFGLARFGEAGEAFDPTVHEALMHTEADLPEGTESTTVVQVLQPGYRAGDRVLRAARVAVADPR